MPGRSVNLGESKDKNMLVNIHVKNMALIQELEIDLSSGLNILTGETGAGKSIIIGAINVALGTQSFKGFAREDAEQAFVELIFSVDDDICRKRLAEMEIIAEDDQIIISRRLTGTRSISKINGETVPVSKIREAAGALLDIHGQHEHQSLLYKKNHLDILDEYCKEELEPFSQRNTELYLNWLKLKNKLDTESMDETARKKEEDFLRFEVEEIGSADLVIGEDEQLEVQYRKMSNGRRIMEAVSEVYNLTGYDGDSAGGMAGKALRSMQSVSKYDEALESLQSQLLDIDSLLNDFNRELSDYISDLSFDEKEFAEVEERLNLVNHLKEKYGKTIEDVFAYKQEKEERLKVLEDYEIYREKLKNDFNLAEQHLYENSEKMSEIRKRHALTLQDEIKKGMNDLNFLEVQFEISFAKMVLPGIAGYDDICFMLSTNPGESLRPLGDVASGGELSRIMLAIKTVLADKDHMGTLIFDEIDVGISGRTAQKVSEKMAVLAKNHQIICITHLAQIAAMADSHYLIEKKIDKQMTITSIRRLTDIESVEELARILGGVEITDIVRKNASEMKDMAVRTKKY